MNEYITDELLNKYNKLKDYILELKSLAIAFSGGVDSTFLLKVAHEVLGDKAIAITSISCLIPVREREESSEFCNDNNIKHLIIMPDPLSIEGFSENPKDRCYICKKALFKQIINAAFENGISYVAEGSNLDDEGDYRPGLKAIAELEVLSPLRAAGLTKSDIRALSKMLGLNTWDKPSYACLASRFVYGEKITAEKLLMIDKAEQYLYELGYRGMRVRIHKDVARIELSPEDISGFMEEKVRYQVSEYFKNIGFNYVSLELTGYSMGSMNKTL